MTIGITGPVDIHKLAYDFGDVKLPDTHTFPLPTHLVNALLRRGHKVIVYTTSGTAEAPFVLEREQITICVGTTRPKPGRRFFDHEINGLSQLMRSYPADVVHAFWTYEFALAALKSGLPTIVGIHDVAGRILRTQFDMFRLVRWGMNLKTIWTAKYLAANSAYTYQQLSKRTQQKTTIINNFYSPELEQALKHPIIKRNSIVTVTMGFTARKGVPRALHAFARLRQQFPDLEYHLIGAEMEPEGPAQQYARQHGLEAGVRFLGPLPIDDLIQHVAEARVMLHPSVEESFGMAPLEAMVVGTPVVGGCHSGFIPHLLNQGEAGLLCDVQSPDAMADSVAKLLADPVFADELAQKARAFAHDNFSEEAVVQRHLELMKQVYDRHKRFSKSSDSVKTEAA
ncbi:glycosyltransferase family 4 protein [Pontibacter roseus]|uniref:glycosyltransferase family 4 protein n=1 Tax=Pontibacter roseus TaxID=336989 RepID=UPI00039D1AA6|nr:glycosyltransferase family 4 protein [Pontibacter roseus]